MQLLAIGFLLLGLQDSRLGATSRSMALCSAQFQDVAQPPRAKATTVSWQLFPAFI